MTARKSTQEFIAEARAIHGGHYDYSLAEYGGRRQRLKIICPVHGVFEQEPRRHLKGCGCKKCALDKHNKEQAPTTEEFIARATSVHGDKYDYSAVVYRRRTEKVEIRCHEHGVFMQAPADHLDGQGCPACGAIRKRESRKRPQDQFIALARARHGDKYDYSKVVYKHGKKPVVIICPKHGEFMQTPAGHLNYGCTDCGIERRAEKRRYTTQEFSDFLAQQYGGMYRVLGPYESSKTPILMQCREHGIYSRIPNDIQQGYPCPKCSDTTSKPQRQLAEVFLDAVQNDREILNGKEIDMLVTHTLGVEVNGCYWHTEAQGKDKWYHLGKTEQAAKKGVKLVHVTDLEVAEQFDKVVGLIKAKAGQFDRRVYARKLSLRPVPNADAVAFLIANHMQGACSASVRYGLYAGDELLALMTFGRPRFSRKYDWELLRFCTVLGMQVVGGASRLFKHFLRNHTGSVVSYANRRWSDGGLYKALGFDSVGVSAPNYVWIRGYRQLTRYQTQKHKLADLLGDNFDAALSETANMEAAGYSRMWDCGNFVFAYGA